MNKSHLAGLALVLALCGVAPAKDRPKKHPDPLQEYLEQARGRVNQVAPASPGSLWQPGARLGDLGLDLRAARVDDIVTILVLERASAVSRGATKSARASSARGSVNAIGVIPGVNSPLPNLARLSSETALDGSGETSRESTLTATLTARVAEVLPNGFLLVEGAKKTAVNSELQTVVVRGVVRPVDLGPGNTVHSDRIGQLEIFLNGKGVVGDAIRRPFILYRILLGLLPF